MRSITRAFCVVSALLLGLTTAFLQADPARSVTSSTTSSSVPAVSTPGAGVYNLRVGTDASPDLTDLHSLINSITARWTTPREKVWALFYWSHILKRQTGPVVLHGFEVTDPIRNLVDFSNTMCSTITGINQSLYEQIGLRHQYWDVCNHTVSAVEFDGAFRMIDSSMSNLVTRDDGVTLATVPEASASSGRLVRLHSLYSTSPDGYLTGSDTARNLSDVVDPVSGSIKTGFYIDFCANNLLMRDYYYNWNAGHRYVLNLREHESYTRYYSPLDTTPDYWVSSERVAAPDPANTFQNDAANRFHLRGNGQWSFTPDLSSSGWQQGVYRSSHIAPAAAGGLSSDAAGRTGEVIYKVQAANVIASRRIQATLLRSDTAAAATISVSVNHGLSWTMVGIADPALGATSLDIDLRDEVNAAYETLVSIRLTAGVAGREGIILTDLSINTITQVNPKALPKLNLGRNEIYIDAGDQSDSMVLWPDLRGSLWQRDVVDSSNIASQPTPLSRTYSAVVYPATLTQDAYLTYRMDAPSDITRVVYGGRLYNYQSGSYIDFLHSFDGGLTWTRSYRLSDVNKPYDVIHYQTVTAVPPGVRSVLFKFLFHNTATSAAHATGLYAARMEVDYRPAIDAPAPMDVTFRWLEVRADRSTVARSHKRLITAFPTTYVIDVGGVDHPIMRSVTTNVEATDDGTPVGYSDGIDAGGAKYLYTTRTDGTNLARSKPYTISRAPSGFQSSAPATNTTILTDGIVGSPVTGGFAYWQAQCWTANQTVDLQVDLGSPQAIGGVRAHLFGYPGWDALAGQVLDTVQVQTSLDGAVFANQGFLQTNLWRKDIPINYMLQDDEHATAWNFELALPSQVVARYVRYHVTPKRNTCVSELQVFDRVTYTPFDIRIAPPTTSGPGPDNLPPLISLTAPVAGAQFNAPATIQLAADAIDPDGTVQRVDFFAGTTLIGTAASDPYAVTWSNVGAGTYSLTARATDDAGATATSAPVQIAVASTRTVPNVVGLTQAAATSAVTAAGLRVGTVTMAPSATVPTGSVINQSPACGTVVAAGSAVALTVSSGPSGSPLPSPWSTQDIGAVGLTGSASFAPVTSMFSVSGAGADIWGTADAFRFVYQPLTGDGEIIARVASVQNSTAWVKAGVMMRVDLSPGSAHGMAMVTPAKGNNFQRRAAADGSTVGTAGAMVTAPYWVRLTRIGSSIAAYQSADGSTWTLIASSAIVMPASIYVGLAVSSHSSGVAATATFDHVSVLPLPWRTQDVGNVGPAGSATFFAATSSYGVSGAGADLWGTSVAFRFMYQNLSGNGQIVARVASVQNSNAWVKAGVMVRGDLTPGSAHGMMMVTPGKGTNYQRRTTTGGATVGTAGALVTAPYWVRLARNGTTLSAYQSADGSTWSLVGSATVNLPANVLVGLAVSSHSTAAAATATFDNVSVLPSPWSTQDVGAVGLRGFATFVSTTSTYRLSGAGADIWGTVDAFRYVYQPFTGDVEVVTRVATVQGANAWVKAGVMIRTDLSPGSAHAMAMVTLGKGNNFQRRTVPAGSTVGTVGAAVTAPYWVKLSRSGSTISAYQSADGISWSLLGSATISMPPTVLVGLAVSSHSTTGLATATFDSVRIAAFAPP